MKVIETELPGVLLLEPKVFEDPRGYFMETWNHDRYFTNGLPYSFVQDNLSYSYKGVLRGLHFQHPDAQGKLVYAVQGEVFDVAVDIRAGSPTFGKWEGFILSSRNNRQLYIPEGFAHGFMAVSHTVLFAYKCTRAYNPKTEAGILWNDPDINIEWPDKKKILSEKDKNYPRLKEIAKELLPKF